MGDTNEKYTDISVYRCKICTKNFNTTTEAEACYDTHKKNPTVVDAIYREGHEIPSRIVVKFEGSDQPYTFAF